MGPWAHEPGPLSSWAQAPVPMAPAGLKDPGAMFLSRWAHRPKLLGPLAQTLGPMDLSCGPWAQGPGPKGPRDGLANCRVEILLSTARTLLRGHAERTPVSQTVETTSLGEDSMTQGSTGHQIISGVLCFPVSWSPLRGLWFPQFEILVSSQHVLSTVFWPY